MSFVLAEIFFSRLLASHELHMSGDGTLIYWDVMLRGQWSCMFCRLRNQLKGWKKWMRVSPHPSITSDPNVLLTGWLLTGCGLSTLIRDLSPEPPEAGSHSSQSDTAAPYSSLLPPDSSPPPSFCDHLLCLSHSPFLRKPRPPHHLDLGHQSTETMNNKDCDIFIQQLSSESDFSYILLNTRHNIASEADPWKMQVRSQVPRELFATILSAFLLNTDSTIYCKDTGWFLTPPLPTLKVPSTKVI